MLTSVFKYKQQVKFKMRCIMQASRMVVSNMEMVAMEGHVTAHPLVGLLESFMLH